MGQPRGRTAANLLFGACLATLVLAITWFLVRPLTPQFLAIHHVPPPQPWAKVGHTPSPLVRPYWPLAAGSFGAALWLWQRGRRPSLWLLLLGVVVLTLLALLVPPFQSLDVYAYSFYGRAQAVFHENPYLTTPNHHLDDPWLPFWTWRWSSAVYGPLFLLLLHAAAVLAGASMLAWVIWIKLLMTAAVLGAVALLAGALRGQGDPRWPLLLVGWNPLVLEGVVISGHVDALPLLLAAAAVFAHRHRWFLCAFGFLVGMLLVKIYFAPLVVLYALWRTAKRPPRQRLRSLAELCGVTATLIVLVYLPFAAAGPRALHSVLRAGMGISRGTIPDVLHRVLTLTLGGLGAGSPTAGSLSGWIVRALSVTAILVGFLAVARRLPGAKQPWSGLAAYFLVYLLASPYIFFWYAIPLLALVAIAPGGPATAAAALWSVAQLSKSYGRSAIGPWVLTAGQSAWLIHHLGASWRGLPASVVSFLGNYAPPLLAAWWVHRRHIQVHAGAAAEVETPERVPVPETPKVR